MLSFESRLPCSGAKVQYLLLYYCLRALPAAVPLNLDSGDCRGFRPSLIEDKFFVAKLTPNFVLQNYQLLALTVKIEKVALVARIRVPEVSEIHAFRLHSKDNTRSYQIN